MVAVNKNVDFNALIPEMKDWNNGKGIDIDRWIGCMANHKILVGCARILWPDFVERDGCIFLASHELNFRDYIHKVEGDKKTTEATTNHIHILHLFGTELPTRELRHDFPDRKFTVAFPEEDDLELLDYEITFFQER